MRFRQSFIGLLLFVAALGALPAASRAGIDPAPAEVGASSASDSIRYAVGFMKGNRIGFALTNYGFLGTNFYNLNPSFEYPIGSSHEHMVRGGLWVGAVALDNNGAFIGVSTAAQDAGAGASAASPDSKISEYTPAGNYIISRSSLPNSQVSDPTSTSELDMISQYSDRPGDVYREHRPLDILVTQYNYEWSFSDYGHIVFTHYVIKNLGPELRNAWIGIYNEFASGDWHAYSSFPPPRAWYSKKEIGWVDSLSMMTERYCQSGSLFPNNCRYDLVSEIVGCKYLGAVPSIPSDTLGLKVTFAAWSWAPGAPFTDTDTLKYGIMSAGTRQNISPLPDSIAPGSGDPVELQAVGPFTSIASGDSVQVDFAYLGEIPPSTDIRNITQIVKRAVVAQRAYNLHYLVPVPPPSPKFKAVARQNAVDYYWDDTPENFIDKTSPVGKDFEGYRIYLGNSRDTLDLIGQFDLAVPPHDTTGFNTGLDSLKSGGPWVVDGVSYPYHFAVSHLRDGFKYYVAVTAYDLGTPDIESLESGIAQNEAVVVPSPSTAEAAGHGVTVFPNPYRVETAWDRGQQARDHYLWFANLPAKAKLRIFTLSGDLVYETDFDGASYNGSNARGIYQPGSGPAPIMSGATFGWDMITRQGQAAATGLYIWAVEDKQTGKRQTGKFLLVKSDRENF